VKAIGRRTGDFLGQGLADDCNPLERIGVAENSMNFLRVVGPARVTIAGCGKQSDSRKASSKSGILPFRNYAKGPLLAGHKKEVMQDKN
jgi:hypothetical protein